MQFRKDLNGLRALAVIAVVLFHFNESWMPGGFAGVDVFFVISGFLMTGIIFGGIGEGRFSILSFYVARANRIAPALAVLCLVLLVFGWFYLTPTDYRALGKHVASSIAFLSNFTYWTESGYFDPSSHEKWLLHTWSLSVEWQFYIIYPLVLVAMSKIMSLHMMKVAVLCGAFLGLFFSIVATQKWPDPAYYLLPTRAWEMMAGGVAYLYPIKVSGYKNKALEVSGLLLIVFSYIFISKEHAWPGYLAVIPVLGTFMVIQAHRNDSVITANIAFQYIGKWSYSIYLWHWPLVVAIYYFYLDNIFVYGAIILSVLLGYLSNKYIEGIRFKRSFNGVFDYLKCKPLHIILFVSLLGLLVFVSRGFEWHYSDEVVVAAGEANNRSPYNCMKEEKFPCYIGNVDSVKAIIVGDSHADALITSISSAYDLSESGIIALTKSSCPLILGMKSTVNGDECLKENERRINFINNNFIDAPVFWIARTAAYIKGQSNPDRIKDSRYARPSIYFSDKEYEFANSDLMNEIKAALIKTIDGIGESRSIFIVLPTPEMRLNVPKKVSRGLLLANKVNNIAIDKSLYIERNNEVIKMFVDLSDEFSNVQLLDPSPYLCDEGLCYGMSEGRPIYFDGDHLSEFGNKLLTPMFLSVLPD